MKNILLAVSFLSLIFFGCSQENPVQPEPISNPPGRPNAIIINWEGVSSPTYYNYGDPRVDAYVDSLFTENTIIWIITPKEGFYFGYQDKESQSTKERLPVVIPQELYGLNTPYIIEKKGKELEDLFWVLFKKK